MCWRDVLHGDAHPGCWHGPRGTSQIAFVLKATARAEDGGPHGVDLWYVVLQARQEPNRAGPGGPTPGPDLQSCICIMMVRRIDVFGCSLDCPVGLSQCVRGPRGPLGVQCARRNHAGGMLSRRRGSVGANARYSTASLHSNLIACRGIPPGPYPLPPPTYIPAHRSPPWAIPTTAPECRG